MSKMHVLRKVLTKSIIGTKNSINYTFANLLIFVSVGVLATPLLSSPAVVLALFAFVYMLLEWHFVFATIKVASQRFEFASIAICFGGWFLVSAATILIHHDSLREIDSPFRFLLGIGVFWFVLATKINKIDWVICGIVAGTVGAAGIAAYQHVLIGEARSSGWTNNPIYFGNLSILLFVYVWIILATHRSMSMLARFALISCLPLSLFASYTSMSRSSFLALASLWVLVNLRRKEDRRTTLLLFIGTAAILALLTVAERNSSEARLTSGTLQEIQAVQQADYRSSLGHRLQMWKGSLILFSSSPIVGVGSGSYISKMEELAAIGVIDHAVTKYNQPHSGIMEALATKGVLGLAGYLLLFAIPYRLFSQLAAKSDAESLLFCRLGMATVIAFFIFGLTNSIFRIQIYSVVYSLSIAIFAALALNFQMQDRKAGAPSDERIDK